MHLKFVFLIFVFACFIELSGKNKIVQGIVYNDVNRNGTYESSEPGVADVLVSNQDTVVKTDANGHYKITVAEGSFVFVVKPSDYEFPGNDANFPAFYAYNPYLQKLDLKYPVAPAVPIADKVNFGLFKKESKKSFQALILGDPQMRTKKQLSYFRDEIASDLIAYENKADFLLILGDIADDSLSIYPAFKEVMKPLNIAKFVANGNHDVNYRATSDTSETETFKHFLGPSYYSFNHGNVHFIVLNTVQYQGWNKNENKAGKYFGGLPGKQLNWLKNDLAQIPDSQLIVLTGHIPFHENYFYKDQIAQLFKLLEGRKNILSLAGHLHATERYHHTPETYWNGAGTFEYLNVGATCGSWWTGPKDENGLPAATCMDGTPNGFFVFSFDGSHYSFKFHEAGKGVGNEFRISYPSGEIDSVSLTDNEIVVNVFAGNKETKVVCSIDGANEFVMEPFIAKDPFIVRTLNQRFNDDNWQPRMGPTNHLWKAAFPKNISKGSHRLKVEMERDGMKFKKEMIFELK